MKVRIVFFGSHGVAVPLLEYLRGCHQVELACVVSQPDRGSGRGKQRKPTAISQWATLNGIPLLCPEKPDKEFAEHLRSLGCDLIFVMAYGHILRECVLTLPRLGIYNFHASILPKYRGASPVETAIACGEKVTGVSLMEIVEKMDAGDVIDMERVPIGANDFASDLYGKLAHACVPLIGRNIGGIVGGTAKRSKQDSTEATFTRKITKLDGCLDFDLSAVEIYNRVRGFHGHVGSYALHNGTTLHIGKIGVEGAGIENKSGGEVVHVDRKKILVSARSGTLALFELQRSGGKMLKINDFLNGYKLAVGDRFQWHSSEPIVAPVPFRRSAAAPEISGKWK
ncbi:MAG: methionyl-tRNA formyltransferase [Puniceicoccales bacterium]|nr:methionyl-tRNA formyltransferase [Puniceicoccales bacterium]